ncbi:calcium-activated chloride channel regulator 1-like [Saccoglossus kowalevskii]
MAYTGIHATCLCCSFLLALFAIAGGISHTKVYLSNNEYHNIVIGIDESVLEDSELLDRIKDVFTDASAFLYEATRKRAFFKNISILVPKSWKNHPQYAVPEFQSFYKSDIRIGTGNAHGPYVYKTTPCGETSDYMHLTAGYMKNDSIARAYGPYEKTIVHEWAHLRWGVYDEYPGGDTPYFYAGLNGEIEATRCSAQITGITFNKATLNDCAILHNLPEPDCRFYDFKNTSETTASLMYRQYLPQLAHFCDNDAMASTPGSVHNYQSPSKHNRLCNEKSVWEVMREHVDFAGGVNPTREKAYTVPDFHVVKQRNKRTVLVLDISDSMNEFLRLDKLRQAVSNYILNIIDDGEELGLVVFNFMATIKSQLVVISDTTREELLLLIPTSDDTDGATSIGGGISKAIEVLEENGSDPSGGCILLVSDGEENTNPFISDVKPTVLQKHVTVDTIAFGADASSIGEQLPAATDGLTFYYSERSDSNALNEAFIAIAKRGDPDVSVLIHSNAMSLNGGEVSTISITIDSTIGRGTEFLFNYLGYQSIEVTLHAPNGSSVGEDSPFYYTDITFQSITIKLPGTAEIGVWTISLYNPSVYSQSVTTIVQSRSRYPGQYPISIKSEWSALVVTPPEVLILYVTIAKGTMAVLNAAVIATIERPNNDPIELTMADDGAGADITNDDGVYSSYFTAFNGDDRYSVKIRIANTNNTMISRSNLAGVGSLIDPDFESYITDTGGEETGEFQRVSSGGSFRCQGSICNGYSDVYAPCKVVDLEVKRISFSNQQITIQFTAPGDDLDFGNATRYEIWMSTAFALMYSDHEMTTNLTQHNLTDGTLHSPRPSGQKEHFTVRVPGRGDITYVFCVVAVDASNNRSPRSNIVSASMKDFTSSTDDNETSFPLAYIMVTITILLLLFVFITTILCMVKNTKNKVGNSHINLI